VTSTIAILWETFGLVGLASAAAWAGAVLLLVAGAAGRIRWTSWILAAGLAAAGVVLAAATSASIRSIEVDRSAEVLAAEAAGSKAVQEKLRGRAANVRFAEDTAADQADVAGVTVAEEEGAYERAVEEQLSKIPAYRSRGKQARRGTKAATAADGNAPAADTAATPPGEAGPNPSATEGEDDVRKLPESQLVVADRFDRGNRAIAWTALVCALGFVGFEYVRRFNTTFDPVWPLPLAGTWIDGAFAKAYVVDGGRPTAAGRDALREFLTSVVRKGEAFVLFAESDPLSDRETLPRLAVGPFGRHLPKRSFAVADVEADAEIAEIVFESAWYGRGAFVLTGDGSAADVVLARMGEILARRHGCRAVARRTVNLVWALPRPPAAETADELRFLCPRMNVRLVVLPPDTPAPAAPIAAEPAP
jgi:hypothetical protein